MASSAIAFNPASIPAIKTLRRDAPVGCVCNPWEKGNYYPLLNCVAESTIRHEGVPITAYDKITHAVLLRQARQNSLRTFPEKAARILQISHREMKRRMDKLVGFGLLVKGKWNTGYWVALENEMLGQHESRIELPESRLPAEFLDVRLIQPTAMLVYTRLAGLSGRMGWWHHSDQSYLAQNCGISRMVLAHALTELRRHGLIRIERYTNYVRVYKFLGHRIFQDF